MARQRSSLYICPQPLNFRRSNVKPKPEILIADDQPIVLNFLKTIVERLGFQPIAAADGKEAWEAYQHSTPVLVITDLRMPHMNGIQLARLIRKQSVMPPILVLTGSFADAVCSELEDIRNLHITRKPVDVREFSALILELTGSSARPLATA
jgi:CheY-like chemotaxis protein